MLPRYHSSMGTLRCSMCSIDYPHSHRFMRCRVCGEQTSYFSNVDADPDWAEDVRLKKGVDKTGKTGNPELDIDPSLDTPDFRWRANALIAAGYDYESSLVLAARQDVDLHKAVDLAEKAGVPMALRILV